MLVVLSVQRQTCWLLVRHSFKFDNNELGRDRKSYC